MKRQVKFSSLIALLNRKRAFEIVGIAMIVFSLLSVLIGALVVNSAAEKPFESYDNEKILREGTIISATITQLSDVTNVRVNHEHPRLIQYQYENGEQVITDAFQTLELTKVADYKVGDKIEIRSLGSQSVIPGIEPYRFPFWLFYLLPLLFFIIGTIFLTLALLPALKIYELYKNGVVKEAEVLAITRNSGMPLTNVGQNILVDYVYLGRDGQKRFGSATTTDIAFMHENSVGSLIKIFVSDSNDEKSALVPRLEAAKNNWKL